MPNEDTIKLLKECNAGVKMGVSGIQEVLDNAQDEDFTKLLNDYLKKHQEFEAKTHEKLNAFQDSEKEPSALAEVMSKAKINMKLLGTPTDGEIADLMTDGCNMGIKSISRYKNKYPAAEQSIKSFCDDLIKIEEDFMVALRKYL